MRNRLLRRCAPWALAVLATSLAAAGARGEGAPVPAQPVTFNSQLALDVMMPNPDKDASGTPVIGSTPSAQPLVIPPCPYWWVAPRKGTGTAALLQEAEAQRIPGLELLDSQDSDMVRLKNLKGLQVLRLHRSSVTNAGLAQLRGLTALQRLELVMLHKVNDSGLVAFANLRDLRWLTLQQMPSVTSMSLACFKNSTRLETLGLDVVNVADAGLGILGNFRELKELSLSGTKITDAGLVTVASLRQLERLGLAETKVTNAGLARLRSLGVLRQLNLNSTAVTDAGLVHLRGLKELQSIHLRDTNVTDAAVGILLQIPTLKYIDLIGTKVTATGVQALHKAFPNADVFGPDGAAAR